MLRRYVLILHTGALGDFVLCWPLILALGRLHAQSRIIVVTQSSKGVLAEARVTAETERLRAALLTSISHDLRTPLASILGAVSSLRSFSDKYDAAQREELLATLQEEAERLNRFVGNLLDMTRLESGAIELNFELFDLGEIVDTALRRATDVLARHDVRLDIAPELPMLLIDVDRPKEITEFNLRDLLPQAFTLNSES